jgi:hypothetical protein
VRQVIGKLPQTNSNRSYKQCEIFSCLDFSLLLGHIVCLIVALLTILGILSENPKLATLSKGDIVMELVICLIIM